MPTQMVTIEGNIGTGKTTIAKRMARHMPDTSFFPAPEPAANPHWRAFEQASGVIERKGSLSLSLSCARACA